MTTKRGWRDYGEFDVFEEIEIEDDPEVIASRTETFQAHPKDDWICYTCGRDWNDDLEDFDGQVCPYCESGNIYYTGEVF